MLHISNIIYIFVVVINQLKISVMQKITLKQARKLWNEGETIALTTSKINEQIINYSPWFSWFYINKSRNERDELETDLDKIINEFSYYSCTRETGLRVNYYKFSV